MEDNALYLFGILLRKTNRLIRCSRYFTWNHLFTLLPAWVIWQQFWHNILFNNARVCVWVICILNTFEIRINKEGTWTYIPTCYALSKQKIATLHEGNSEQLAINMIIANLVIRQSKLQNSNFIITLFRQHLHSHIFVSRSFTTRWP